MAMKRLSVIVCTRNRCETLAQALESLMRCEIPPGWQPECVVVDNGSTDRTKDVVTATAAQASMPMGYVYTARIGLSHARNAGVRAASGGLVAFTDDDCEVQPDWLCELVAAFERYPDVAGIFGQVMSTQSDAAADVGTYAVAIKTDGHLTTYRLPCNPISIGHGNNMAFRREALRAVGEFDVALGAGGPLRSGEDLEMAYRLLRRGSTLVYEPRCVIRHRPRASAASVRQTHWRNAIGIGACFGKHLFLGDVHALKCLWWFLSDLPASSWRAWRRHHTRDITIPWIYLLGVPCGVARWLGYAIPHRATRSGQAELAPCRR